MIHAPFPLNFFGDADGSIVKHLQRTLHRVSDFTPSCRRGNICTLPGGIDDLDEIGHGLFTFPGQLFTTVEPSEIKRALLGRSKPGARG